MTQPTLFDAYTEPLTPEAATALRARVGHPATSRVAASESVRFAGSHEAQIVAILSETQGALTTHEIAERSPTLRPSQVFRRMAGLGKLVGNGPIRLCRCERKKLATCDGKLPMQTWKTP